MSDMAVRAVPGTIDLIVEGPAVPQPATAPIGGRVVLMGFSVRETGGVATASIVMRNGTDATGLDSGSVDLNVSESVRDWFGPDGILFDNGYFPVVTGAVAGAVYVRLANWNRG